MNLQQKLLEIRKVLPYLQKAEKSFGYNYVKGADILAKIQHKMNELGVLLFPSIRSYDLDNVDTGKKNKKNQDITEFSWVFKTTDALMIFMNADNPEETLAVPFAFIGEQNDPAKAYGSALTYSERYFLMKFFNIPTDEDDPDKFHEKHIPERTLEEMYSDLGILYDSLISKGLIQDSEKDILLEMIEKSKGNKGKLIATAKQLESRNINLDQIKINIKKGLNKLKYQKTHEENSIKKHLGTATVNECNNFKKLNDYLNHLRKEFKEKK